MPFNLKYESVIIDCNVLLSRVNNSSFLPIIPKYVLPESYPQLLTSEHDGAHAHAALCPQL